MRGEEKRKPHLIWSAWRNHVHVNNSIVGAESLHCVRLTWRCAMREERWIEMTEREREWRSEIEKEKMNDEGDWGMGAEMTGKGVRWQVGRDEWGERCRADGFSSIAGQILQPVSSLASCKSVIKAWLVLMYCTCLGWDVLGIRLPLRLLVKAGNAGELCC